MPVSITLTDSEGFTWDINAVSGGVVGIEDGSTDTFDGAMQLAVNGTNVNPQNASLDGRNVTMQPVMIDGIAVQRQILVSDGTLSATGFARFLDSFTNTTDAQVTITVTTKTNSGADFGLQFPLTTSGNTTLDANDTGFTTSDGVPGGDTRAMIAFGEAGSLNSLPAGVSVVDDNITVTHSITLAPGETRSLLQFATQNNADTDASGDLTAFTQNAFGLLAAGALVGLSREEQLSIVNYTGFGALTDPLELRDSDGNLWTIGTNGSISSPDGAITNFRIPILSNNWTTVTGVTEDKAANEVTIATAGFVGSPNSTVTYNYKSLDDLGVIRLVVTFDNTLGPTQPFQDFFVLGAGASGTQLVAQQNGGFNNQVLGVVIDDSASGSGGLVPAATVVWGAVTAGDAMSVQADTLVNNFQNVTFAGGQLHTLVFFLASNDTGLAALADLVSLSNPGPRLLEGMSAVEVANLRNFDINEFQGRLQEVLGADEVDDVIVAHEWGDSILGDSGDDEILSLGSDDVVRGGIGNDMIDGGTGADSLFGGVDNDLIIGGTGSDAIFGEDGADSLFGQTDADTLFGGNGDDRLVGASGADLLFGGADADTLHGNIGNDTMAADAGADVLFGGAGDDQAAGGGEADTLSGGTGNDSLEGGAGNDSLNGDGGNDTLLGGAGDDTYVVDSANDRVFETTTTATTDDAGGIDTVLSALSFNLGASAGVGFVETLILTGTGNTNGIGNTLDNLLTGTSGSNTLNGKQGNDTMLGGDGDDTYIVGSGGDRVFETTTTTSGTDAGGTDTVQSAVSFSLASDTGVGFVENLLLLGATGIDATGNALANTLTGNTGSNLLDGGLGNDTMLGGFGNDTYVIDSSGDRVFETTTTTSSIDAGGIDTVQSGVTLNLGTQAGLAFVERLELTGTDNINGAGNGMANRLTGNSGNNQLNGGLGNDFLTGGDGADFFLFNTTLGAANIDRITDYTVIDDTIRLDDARFAGLTTGALDSASFAANLSGTARDAADRIIYETDTGRLFFDADGDGAGARIQFAVLTANLALSSADFQVI